MEKSPLKPLVIKLFMVPILMFGFGYLMVPIYDVFCDITGLNGKTGAISSAQASQLQVNEERLIKVQFLSSVNQSGPWDFKPQQFSMMVSPGKPYTAHYVARNKLGKDMVSQSIPSVTPSKAAAHFDKMECFCFTEQKFKANEERDMPLVFVIDPDIPDDVDIISLSYTLFTKEQS